MRSLQFRQLRIEARIPGALVCARSGMSRSRLSDIERRYVQPSEEELARIEHALNSLIAAKDQVKATAAAVGWPF